MIGMRQIAARLVTLLVITVLAQLVARDVFASDDPFEAALALWDRGSYDSSVASLQAHFKKHGREVGADSLRSYALKASGLYYQVKDDRWTSGAPVAGETANVRRFVRGDRYIDIYKTDSNAKFIISFGGR